MMVVATGQEYEYVRKLVFFGFMCGMTFSLIIAMLVSRK